MEHLRWILLAAGVVLIVGVYLWGLRGRRRSATPEPERMARVEPAMTTRHATQYPRLDPQLDPAQPELGPDDVLPVIEVEREDWRTQTGAAERHEPRFEIEEPVAATPEPDIEPVAAPVEPSRRESRRNAPDRPPPEHKVIALRIVSAAAAPFPGRALREAIESQGLAFGRYRIFHRLYDDGRSVFSLASLKEPGTFDLATMDEGSFRGVAMFVVLPGPVEGASAVDELVAAARAIAGRVGGMVQDERGVALGVTRAAQLRAEAAPYEPVATGT